MISTSQAPFVDEIHQVANATDSLLIEYAVN